MPPFEIVMAGIVGSSRGSTLPGSAGSAGSASTPIVTPNTRMPPPFRPSAPAAPVPMMATTFWAPAGGCNVSTPPGSPDVGFAGFVEPGSTATTARCLSMRAESPTGREISVKVACVPVRPATGPMTARRSATPPRVVSVTPICEPRTVPSPLTAC
jgi:hypothetical protein